jgi:hypothetical protein
MKSLVLFIVGGLLVLACQEDDRINQDYTGNETVYSLQQGSAYAVDGTVTFKEKTDGSTVVVVALSGTEGSIEHPVHLHLGNISAPGADVAALLNPVLGKSGMSETTLNLLSDETKVTYKELTKMDACIKVHLAASGPDRDIILAGGNVGSAAIIDASSGRSGIGVCKSDPL